MGKNILLGHYILAAFSVTLAWDCSDYEEKQLHPWCEHGCCFEKDPVECCTWAESMGSVFWTFVGLGSALFLLSIIVGVVCCLCKKKGFEGQIISNTGVPVQGPLPEAAVTSVSERNRGCTTITSRIPAVQVRIPNRASRYSSTPQSQQSRQVHLTTNGQRNRPYSNVRTSPTVNQSASTTSNLNPRTLNTRSTTVSNLNTRSITTSGLHPSTANSNIITTSNLRPRTVNSNTNTSTALHPRSVNSNTNTNLQRSRIESNSLNSNATERPATEEPPPSYESLFLTNS